MMIKWKTSKKFYFDWIGSFTSCTGYYKKINWKLFVLPFHCSLQPNINAFILNLELNDA